jgi:GntR family transcriptional repressor for pyruvate dehydrogenase complex
MTPPRPPNEKTIDSSQTLAAIGPIARSSVVDAVADRLRGEILAGRIPAGSKLPSERELSLALGVNRLTLRASLARLEALGLITTRHGAGTLVASWRERASLDALATLVHSLTPDDPTWHELVTSTLEIRRILASEAIALAAARHDAHDLELIVACQKQLQERVHDPLAYARTDLAFMRAVVRAARNIGLELLLNTFAKLPDENPALILELYDHCEEAVLVYDVLVGLIRNGDADFARTTVRRALEDMDARWAARHPRAAKTTSAEPQATAAPTAAPLPEGAPSKPTKKRGKR